MDNCFAIKRWITPSQWMPLIRELGATSVEASTDNEMDALFSPTAYRDDWVEEVERCEKEYGMKVRSFFTGYQTYRTTGLAHPDPRMRKKLKEEWFKPLITYAGRLNADIGFSFHALQEEVLQDPDRYAKTSAMVVDEYAELAAFAWDNGRVGLCCEQMYAPYQTPWTLDGTEAFLRDVYAKGGRPFYTAVDVGHMVGQAKYRKPTRDGIVAAVKALRSGAGKGGVWVGPIPAFDTLHDYAKRSGTDDDAFADELLAYLENYPYMFAGAEDSDPFAWATRLGPLFPHYPYAANRRHHLPPRALHRRNEQDRHYHGRTTAACAGGRLCQAGKARHAAPDGTHHLRLRDIHFQYSISLRQPERSQRDDRVLEALYPGGRHDPRRSGQALGLARPSPMPMDTTEKGERL